MSGRDLVGIFNLIIIAAVLGGISYAALVLRPAEYDRETLCLVGETPPHRVVIIDKTDIYSARQAGLIGDLIVAEGAALDVGERLSLFELNEQGRLQNTNRFSLCNPGSGEQVNPLYRNPDRVQARYDFLFDQPLQTALADLVRPKEAPNSPIIEALAMLAQEPGFDRATPRRRAVLVSDMLQNSQVFTVYGRGRGALAQRVPPARQVAQAIVAAHGDGLYGMELEIRLIPRPNWEVEQRGDLRRYWDAVFRELGVRVFWTALPSDQANS